jgi:hypothetical protein
MNIIKDSHHKIIITLFNLNTTFVTLHRVSKTGHRILVTQYEESSCWWRAHATWQAVYAYLQIKRHITIFAFLLLNNTYVTTVGRWAKNTCCSPEVDLIHLKLKLKSNSIEQTEFNVCRLGTTHGHMLSNGMTRKYIRERLQMQLKPNLFILLVF